MNTSSKNKYAMRISRLTVDKLGVKLYDKVSAVIAELIANSYDADATEVTVAAPMNEFLATKTKGVVKDKGFEIKIVDNGIGMTPAQVNELYLVVGKERRRDRGDISPGFKRKVMGRKGVGKLAPFGICEQIEILSAGGQKVTKGGKEGYVTAHLILLRSEILSESDQEYAPKVGDLDDTLSESSGTTITLRDFHFRQVPDAVTFARQISQRFGITSKNWKIAVVDSTKGEGDPQRVREIDEFDVDTEPGTKIEFKERAGGKFVTLGPDGKEVSEFRAGFTYEDVFYPITGWVAYSKEPYRDDLMAGVRLYCRGKIAGQTMLFNMRAGFHGEYDIRSYFVGELHVNWLDEANDLIRTDRQDILWSHDLGVQLEIWGQALVRKIGTLSREPQRKKSWEIFLEKSGLEERLNKLFPEDSHEDIRRNTMEVAKAITRLAKPDELQITDNVRSLADLSMALGPHITLTKALKDAADDSATPLQAVTQILRLAKVAELSSFGMIVHDRIEVMRKVEDLKDDSTTDELELQNLIAEAPWLINPAWSPITANQSFSSLKREFEKFYEKNTGEKAALIDFKNSSTKKRADFVMSSQDGKVQLIEIKKPGHALKNDEMQRIDTYIQTMQEFLDNPGHDGFKENFSGVRVTLVCDKLSLTGTPKSSFAGYKKDGTIQHITWATFLHLTKQAHKDFLNRADKIKSRVEIE